MAVVVNLELQLTIGLLRDYALLHEWLNLIRYLSRSNFNRQLLSMKDFMIITIVLMAVLLARSIA